MANSRISDLNKITSLDPTINVQGSGMFLVANKKVGCEHIEYRDLKTSITDHTVFTTGDQLNILGNKTFKGTVTFEGGHTDGTTGPLTDLAANLFTTGQTLNDALAALDVDHDADSIKANLFNTGQLLNDKIIAMTTDVVVSTPRVQSSDESLSITGSQLDISGAGNLSVSTFKTATVNTTESLSFTSDTINSAAATNFNISSPVVTIGEDVFIKGDLFVSGETVSLDVGSLSIEDKTIELAVSTTGTDGTSTTAATNNTTADGAGLIVKSSEGDKTWLWEKDTLSWESNQVISAEGSLIIKNPTLPPAESDAAEGEVGEMRWDNNFLYIKTYDGWRRALLMDWGP